LKINEPGQKSVLSDLHAPQPGAVLTRRYLEDFLCGPSDLDDQDFTSYSDDDIVIA
jgi:hypothetical protein